MAAHVFISIPTSNLDRAKEFYAGLGWTINPHFTDKPIVDPAVAVGGREVGETQDYGFMYSRDFEDPDGNHFGVIWMYPVAAEIGPEAFRAQQENGS